MAALRIFARSKLSAVFRASHQFETLKNTLPAVTQVQKRWGSYKSSPIYKDPSHYTDYDVTKDPIEWKYVERLLKIKKIPKPPLDRTDLPSGWKPPVAKPVDHPYYVRRTRNYMQPVYLHQTHRGMRKITILSKIDGNIWALESELKKYLEENTGNNVGVRINELIGEIKLRGDYVSHVKRWLDAKGF